MRIRNIIITALVILWISGMVFGQQHTENKADQTLRGSGRVNPSTLGMEIDIPLGNYSGRGINVPIGLSYSSKVWRMDSIGSFPIPSSGGPPRCVNVNEARFGENSASGWTTSMQEAYIEYTGYDNRFDGRGFAVSNEVPCIPEGGNSDPGATYIKRIQIHLPSGESHEFRMSDNPVEFSNQSTTPSHPDVDANWNGMYYAVDGSNLRYFEDRTNNVYKLQLPDGSYYEFSNSKGANENYNFKTIRRAVKFIDRNGNSTTYHEPTTLFPNGYWTDTLGRNLSVPLPRKAPTTTGVKEYEMPGMIGGSPITYKFYWKKLKDTTAANSALTDFTQDLKYAADMNTPPGTPGIQPPRPGETALFHTSWAEWVVDTYTIPDVPAIFNPILLTAVEMPNGQMYRFSYNIFGEIDKVIYPTGGKEVFEYDKVPALTRMIQPGTSTVESNRGIKSRKVYESETSQNPYISNYTAENTSGYKVTIVNPDLTKTERLVHPGRPPVGAPTNGQWGYDNALSGMAYEETGYNSLGQIVSKKLTNWTKTILSANTTSGNIPAEWHPRVASEESIIYDETGNALSTTATMEYEGDLNQRETPLLTKKSSQYKFVTVGSPLPVTPERVSETQYLQSDPNILQSRKDIYKSLNMVGLATSSVVKDGSGNIVSRSETAYDEANYSPSIWHGNPTTSRVWDSTKGTVTNQSAYLETHAKFDGYGNQIESTDAKGNVSTTEYDVAYHAFAVKTKTPIADPTGVNGSNISFETSLTYDFNTGLPLTTTDANGQTTTMEYDPVTLRPKKVTPPTGAGISETIYNDVPNNYQVKNRTQIDANNWAESITYLDGLGRAYKSEKVDSEGNIFSEKEFDYAGRPKRVTNPYRSGEAKVWTTNVYDEQSRVKQVTLPDGATVKTDYGVSNTGIIGITKQITDQAGKKRKGFTDSLGRMVRVIEDPTGQNLTTDYVFDTLGNLRKTIQGEQSRYFTYDSLGRLLFAKQPEQEANTAFTFTDSITGNTQWSVKYQYDDNGNIVSTTDARGVSVAGTYDNINRLKLRDYSDATPDVNFYYDGKGLGAVPNYSRGKTTKVTSSVSETRYTSFDNLGKLLTSEQRTPFIAAETIATATPRVSSYQYNAYGALVSETYPSGRKVNYEFNQDGEIARIGGSVGTQTRLYANAISYNSSGAMERLRLGNGKWESASYNNRLQVTEIGLGNSATDKSLLKLEFGYGNNTQNNGAMRSQKISFNGLSQAFEQTYAYDDLNRLQSATEKVSNVDTWKQTFQYDRFGNRRLDAANTTTIGVSNKVTNPLINTSDNRLKKDQDGDSITDYDYDKAGNLIQDAESRTFFYDGANHQKEVKENGVTKGIYLYDGDGRRVKKITDFETTIFVHNGGGKLVAEYSTVTSNQPQISYLTQDHLGSPRVITDNKGQIIARKDFSAFGDETYTTQRTTGLGYKPEEIRQDYTGYKKDDETGLEYALARYYNNKQGRFTSVDPLLFSAKAINPQTFNRYSYALNSPYKFNDPLGLLATDTTKDESADSIKTECPPECTEDEVYTDADGNLRLKKDDSLYTLPNEVSNVTVVADETRKGDKNDDKTSDGAINDILFFLKLVRARYNKSDTQIGSLARRSENASAVATIISNHPIFQISTMARITIMDNSFTPTDDTIDSLPPNVMDTSLQTSSSLSRLDTDISSLKTTFVQKLQTRGISEKSASDTADKIINAVERKSPYVYAARAAGY